jgi:hypothetical protein
MKKIKKNEDLKTERVVVLFSKEEVMQITAKAKEQERTLSNYIRVLALGKI